MGKEARVSNLPRLALTLASAGHAQLAREAGKQNRSGAWGDRGEDMEGVGLIERLNDITCTTTAQRSSELSGTIR